jgi:hypothetical protein
VLHFCKPPPPPSVTYYLNDPKDLKIILRQKIWYLAAPLTPLYGTLVGKHWFRTLKVSRSKQSSWLENESSICRNSQGRYSTAAVYDGWSVGIALDLTRLCLIDYYYLWHAMSLNFTKILRLKVDLTNLHFFRFSLLSFLTFLHLLYNVQSK